jgi:hypothetical protein
MRVACNRKFGLDHALGCVSYSLELNQTPTLGQSLLNTIDEQTDRSTRHDPCPVQARYDQAHGPTRLGLHSPTCLTSGPGTALQSVFRAGPARKALAQKSVGTARNPVIEKIQFEQKHAQFNIKHSLNKMYLNIELLV